MRSRGNVLLIIIGILAIIFIMATHFMQSTLEEKTQTLRSNRAIQTQCMAEAGLEIAMGYIATKLNHEDSWKDTSSLGNLIRRPLNRTGNKLQGIDEDLGTDFMLDVAGVNQVVKIKKSDLAPYAGEHLDDIFKYTGGDDPGKEYDLEVSFKIEKAVTNLPGPSVDGVNYKIPGLDIAWECHSKVKEFLDNQGYPSITLSLPDGLQWLKIPITIKLGSVELFSLDLISILSPLLEGTAAGDILDLTDLNKLLTKVFEGTGIYPYEIMFATNVIPDLGDKFGNITLPSDISETDHLEKIGYLTVESKATITYPDTKVVTKTIIATKEFKCADIEPTASLYSFFISNLNDSWLNFNNLGGNLYVNNFAGIGAILGTPAKPHKREFPGLVRVNGTQRMEVNTSILGDPMAVGFSEDDNVFQKVARGCEWLLMMDFEFEMNRNLEAPQTVTIKESTVTTAVNKLPSKLQGPATKAVTSLKEKDVEPEGKKEKKSILSGTMNVVPTDEDLGIFLWQAPLHFLGLPGGDLKSWEMPYCGNSWSQFTIPLPLFSTSVTHFFGSLGVYPPMTRDIEGYIAKRYRQWNVGVISLPPTPAPIGKGIPTPWGVTLLPIPVPLWHAHNIVNKYEYNFYALKTTDAQSNPDEVKVYDPSYLANSPPNLYSIEQYAKKANFYYPTKDAFLKDLPNRMVQVNGKSCFRLDGVTFIKESITLPPDATQPFYVVGKGMIVCGGNVSLKGNIEDPYTDAEERDADSPRTVFSLIIRHGGLICPVDAPKYLRFEGSLYTDKCIALPAGKGLKIVGNWVTNAFGKSITRGDIMVEHVGYKTRASLNSIHPTKGKFDPERYFVSLAPTWETWRVQ